jgi:site-specific DNA recombinase
VGLTVGYVRVSTEDQVEYSPEAQANRCRQFAREHDLGAVTILRDEGWSGKDLERPAMRELVALVEADRVTDIVTWRLDRLSRDTGDLNFLVRLCERHCVTLHPINEGAVDLRTASGRMQVGVHGVFAQFYREHIVENVRLGMEHAAQQGRWLNRAPTGYDMIDARLAANGDAAVVRRIFTLRAAGLSYNDIQAQTGVGYSTARHIVENRVYLGEVRLRDRWFPGIHEPLVTPDEWTAARRPHIPGRRRGRDVLSGRVRCGLCRRVVGVDYNQRGQAIYKCRHRGRGCDLPGRSANGLHRAAVLGLRLLAQDEDLRTAIRHELDRNEPEPKQRNEDRERTIASLQLKRRKLLDLHYADHISAEAFADEEARLAAQIEALRLEGEHVEAHHAERDELIDRFEEVATLLASIDIETVWEAATTTERRVLIEDLVDAVLIHADRLVVQVNGAPPLLVTLAEVGLRDVGTRTSVSEG